MNNTNLIDFAFAEQVRAACAKLNAKERAELLSKLREVAEQLRTR